MLKIEQMTIATRGHGWQPSAAEAVDGERKAAPRRAEPEQAEKKVPSEEVLTKIKRLTEEGLYSVRFEMDQEIDLLVVRVVDRESGDLIRQIPSEEVLGVSKSLRELRGLLVNTES